MGGVRAWVARLRVRRFGSALKTPRGALVGVLTIVLLATLVGAVPGVPGTPVSLTGMKSWLRSLVGDDGGPAQPRMDRARTADAGTNEFGLEKFYPYAGVDAGGSQAMVNLHNGNMVFSYDAFDNPSRGLSTFVRLTYNSLDTSTSSAGLGWSVSATTLTRLGSPLQFHPRGQKWPADVTLVDGDGTSQVFKLNKHGSKDQAKWDYDHPAGVHLYLQRVAAADPTRHWVMTKPDGTRFFFDDGGYQSAIVDSNGNELHFSYTERKSRDEPTKFLRYITDPAGRRTLTIEYFTRGDRCGVKDDAGDTQTEAFLTNPHVVDQIKSITDVDGRRIDFTYTDKGLLSEFADGAGTPAAKVYRFGYTKEQSEPDTKLAQITDPRGNATRLSYFTARTNPKFKGWARTITSRVGGVTTLDYVDPDGPHGSTMRTTVIDARSHPSQYAIDGRGRPTTLTNTKGQVTQFGWDADNNVVRLQEANGAVTTSVYDPNTGYPREAGDAEANARRTAPTRLSYQTGLNGHVARLATTTSPQGRTTAFGYDAAGNLVAVTDPAGTATPVAGDFTTRYSYDGSGQLLTETDANGHVTRYGGYEANGLPTSVTDALGHTTVLAYSARGEVGSVTDARGKTSTYGHDLFGRPLAVSVPKNAAAGEYLVTPAPVYDANDNVTLSTAASGAQTTFGYDAADQVVAAFAPKDTPDGPERKTSYEYDKVGNLLAVTEPNGNLTPADPDDFVTRYSYDEIYQTTSVSDARAGTTSYTYDAVGNMTMLVDPNKNVVARPGEFTAKYVYDLNHRPTKAADAAGNTASTSYDLDGNVTAATDEEGNTTLIGYDPRGLVSEVKVPHDTVNGAIGYRTTRYEYDQVGNRTKVVSPRGVATADDPDDFADVTAYDELNQVKEQILPFDKDDEAYTVGEKVINSYDEVGNLVKVSLPPSGRAPGVPGVRVDTSYSYFDNGWIASSTDAFSAVTRYDYDAVGQQTQRTATGADGGLSRTMRWTYHPDGKVRTRIDDGVPVGSNVLYVDNSDQGNLTQTSGPVPWTTSGVGTGYQGYDYATHAAGTGENRFIWSTPVVKQEGSYEVFVRYPAVAGAATNATFSLSDNDGDRDVTVDQTQHAGEWVSLGRLQLHSPFSYVVSLSDKANGTVVADAVKYVRDNSASVDNEFLSFSYSYDANGNLTSLSDVSPGAQVGGYQLSYNTINRLVRMEESTAGVVRHLTTFAYDANGNPTRRTFDGAIDTFEYDSRDLLSKVVNNLQEHDPAPKITTFTYTPRAQVAHETKGNGNTVDYTYFADGLPRHAAENIGTSRALVAEHTLEYDLNGNRTRDLARLMNAEHNDAYLDRTHSYTYDPRDRVIGVANGDRSEKYSYDANSNILSEILTEPQNKNTVTSYTYDRNRLLNTLALTEDPEHGKGGVNSDYVYDSFGKLRTIDGSGVNASFLSRTEYTYDGFDRKLEQSYGAGPVSQDTRYAYDPLSRTTSTIRTSKLGSDPEKTTTTTYRYVGASDLVQLEERNGIQFQNVFQYGPSGERLSQLSIDQSGGPSGQFYYSYSPHGDVEAVTGPTGQTAATYGYTAYGQDDPTMFTGVDKPDPGNPNKQPVNTYRFNARPWDQATGGYDMGFRDYSPTAGRFLTPDFYQSALADLRLGTSPATANRYAFASGNPINRIEVDGHYSWKEFGIDAAIFAITAVADIGCNILLDVETLGTGFFACAAGAGALAGYLNYEWKDQPGGHTTEGAWAAAGKGAVLGLLFAPVGYGIGKGLSWLGGKAFRALASRLGGGAEAAAEAGAPAVGASLVPKATVSLGNWGEARLARYLGGAGSKPAKPFATSTGRRYVDRLVNGIAHESKAGINVKLNASIEKQILKDVELIQTGRIAGAHWHFWQGATRDLLDFLTENRIPYTLHP